MKPTHDDTIEAKDVYIQLSFERYKVKLMLRYLSLSVLSYVISLPSTETRVNGNNLRKNVKSLTKTRQENRHNY